MELERPNQESLIVKRLDRYVSLNELLTEISRELFAAPPEMLDTVVEIALSRFGAFFDSDRAYIFRYSPERHEVCNTHEWCQSGIAPQIDEMQDVSADMAPAWIAAMRGDQDVVINDVGALGEDWSAERRMLSAQGIRSLVAVPLLGIQGFTGFMGFDAVREVRTWLEDEVRALRLLGDFILLALTNRDTLRRLEASEFRWKFALEGSSQGVWDWDLENGSVFYSPRWKRMLGLADEDVDPDVETWSSRVHPDDLPRVMADLEDFLEGRTAEYHSEYRLRHESGFYVWVLDRGAAVSRDASGRALRVIGTHTDVSEQRDMFSAGPTVVFRWLARDGWPVTFCSNNVRRVLGYAPDDLMRAETRYQDLMHPDDRQRVVEDLARHLEAGADSFEQEYRLRHASGGYRYFYVHVRVRRLDGGEVDSLYGYLLDTTRQHESQEEHLRVERELQQSRKLEALGQLTSGVAHEFNNMLAIILGAAGLARRRLEKEPDAAMRRYVEHIQKAGGRARELTRQMLAFGRTQESRPERLSPAAAVQEAISLAKTSLPSSIEIVYRTKPGLPDLMFDAGELQQVLTNLLINAKDAMNGKGRIEVALARLDASSSRRECVSCHNLIEGEWLEIVVADSGPGITAEDLPRIFDPFFSTKPVGEGTGLGLSVVQGIVERNAGHILIDSEPGKGAAFRLLFPLLERQPAARVERAAPRPATTALEGRVLLVDDEPGLADLIAEMLTAEGLRVKTFYDGRQALTELISTRERFDILVTDQTMPGLLGTELAAEARHWQPGLRVILVTGHSRGVESLDDGGKVIDTLLLKPLDGDALLDAIRDLLEAPSTAD